LHRRVLDNEGGRGAGLPAGRQALGHTKEDQQDRGEQANGWIAGKHPHAGSGQRHHDDHQPEHLTAAAAIAAAAEQDGTHGPEDEGGGEHREGCQQVGVPIPAGEIGDREDRGEGAVEREVVPLDSVADAGRNQRPPRARPAGHRATWRLPTATAPQAHLIRSG
jgi:hypothetical protein